ncbi:hypothetical protein WOLCODRAFT_146538 [Wolfiporia cocos MD-104 SS10]|uniref:DUF6533 domain-containing protein n=1 Tax=Wolfiporia cocos (strain MD-104) TaxID=742152 RepID=A0A2H3JBC3_WOLCO|nr:hypothetical protein WOLCODRAFT_146538 [Wolfiporia cocos MD-104 SS10]
MARRSITALMMIIFLIPHIYDTSKVASLAVVLYDYSGLTLQQEVKYMWRGRFVWSRVLFWMNRYWPIANLIFDNFVMASFSNSAGPSVCTFWFRWFLYANIVTRISISGIAIMRVYVMYDCRRSLLIILCTLFVGELVAETAVFVMVVYNMHDRHGHHRKLFTGCIPGHVVPWAWSYWIPILSFESLLFVLALVKVIQQLCTKTHTPRLMVLLLRDSLLYFTGVLCAILCNFFTWKMGSEALFYGFMPVTIAINSLLGCHMLLNIQKAGRPHLPFIDVDLSTSSAIHTMSDLDEMTLASLPQPRLRRNIPSLDDIVDDVIDIYSEADILERVYGKN